MIGSRFIPRAVWEPKLRALGCVPLEGTGRLNTAEWWRQESGYPFTVPVEQDGSCDFWAFQKLRQQLGHNLFDWQGPERH
jgi:hypothetical protein